MINKIKNDVYGLTGFSQKLRHVLSSNDVAAALGVSSSTISRWKNGHTFPDASEIMRISAIVGHPPSWFFSDAESAILTSSPIENDDVTYVPVLDVAAAAGDGVDNHSDEIIAYLPFPLDFLRRRNINPDNVKAIRAYGDSMEPTIPDRALVIIDVTKSDLRDGRIYALRAPDGLRLKRIQRQMDGSVVLISDNKDRYPPEHLAPHDAELIKVVGRAFWTERLI